MIYLKDLPKLLYVYIFALVQIQTCSTGKLNFLHEVGQFSVCKGLI